MSEVVEGNDFWIQKRPFLLNIDHSEPLDENVSSLLGWTPAGSILLAAMCNSDLDHRLLGKLCLHFARKYDGWVDFGGALISHLTGNLQGLPGRVCTIPYITGLGEAWVSHIADADFFEAWLHHPGFHLIK
jgi:hypothetical protein